MEEILTLCMAMGASGEQEGLLRPLIEGVSAALEQELKTGLTPQDCAGAFAAAAAMLTMDALDSAEGAVDSFTAGEVSIRTAAPSSGGSRSAAARRLLAPWLKERGFAFRGVSG